MQRPLTITSIRSSTLLLLSTLLIACTGTPPKLGLIDGRLSICPSSPNCVSSTVAGSDAHFVEAIRYDTNTNTAKDILKTVLSESKRFTLIHTEEKSEGFYLRGEFRSRIMRYVDDVEFHFSASQNIDVRSASRLGHSDFGVNRERVEDIRTRFQKELSKAH